ncbi:MAG TPA: GNAT family N-acetyltransferase [Smithella sp.]|nr:GNAT family N-acetyltransferase [Smithella sp.]MDM7986637.1 GNAT family N-acetyltransferase [Smithella sp.]HNY51787.1 GNAT family N-acetyltransferase [Smithella sp.]HQG66840.1 GNAT family N-acetyltransferase [Smithella sp.]
MSYSEEISSSEPAEEQYVSFGGELSLSNLGQKELLLAMMEKDAALRTVARGFSMHPFIHDKDILTLSPIQDKIPAIGDVVAFTQPLTGRLAIHRIISKTGKGWMIKGDNCEEPDGIVPDEKIIGYVSRVERNVNEVRLAIGPYRRMIAFLSRFNLLTGGRKIMMLPRRIAGRILRILQALSVYRGMAKILASRIDISEASEQDMEMVHEMFNPGVPYRRQEPNPDVTNWVAKKNGRIIAFTQNVYHPEENHPWTGHWLFSLFVRARYRGTGIGAQLTEKVISKAKEQRADDILLVVYDDNNAAIRLYRKFGFEIILHPDLEPMLAEEKITTGRRRIVMRKKLRQANE